MDSELVNAFLSGLSIGIILTFLVLGVFAYYG